MVIPNLTPVGSGQIDQLHPDSSYLICSSFPWQRVAPEKDLPRLRVDGRRFNLKRRFPVPLVLVYRRPHPHRGYPCHRFLLVRPNLHRRGH